MHIYKSISWTHMIRYNVNPHSFLWPYLHTHNYFQYSKGGWYWKIFERFLYAIMKWKSPCTYADAIGVIYVAKFMMQSWYHAFHGYLPLKAILIWNVRGPLFQYTVNLGSWQTHLSRYYCMQYRRSVWHAFRITNKYTVIPVCNDHIYMIYKIYYL